VDAFEAQDFI